MLERCQLLYFHLRRVALVDPSIDGVIPHPRRMVAPAVTLTVAPPLNRLYYTKCFNRAIFYLQYSSNMFPQENHPLLPPIPSAYPPAALQIYCTPYPGGLRIASQGSTRAHPLHSVVRGKYSHLQFP